MTYNESHDNTVQDCAAYNSFGKTEAKAVLELCEQDKVKRLARDIGFKGGFKKFQEEHLYLVLFIQDIACEISFSHDVLNPFMENYHRFVREAILDVSSKPNQVEQFEVELRTRHHKYHELVMYREGMMDTSVLLAELPYYFLAYALNKSSDEATYFMSRQKLCANLNKTGFPFLKTYIMDLFATCLSNIDSLLKKAEGEQGLNS
jgi:hypothetical protein